MEKVRRERQSLIKYSVTFFAGGIKDTKSLIAAMKDALGDVLDDTTMKALEVSAVMESAGASKEEIEEMMSMIMNKGGGISQEFIENIKKAMEAGRKLTEVVQDTKY